MEIDTIIDLKAEPSNNRLVHGPMGLSMILLADNDCGNDLKSGNFK